jgi:hypothetical protein
MLNSKLCYLEFGVLSFHESYYQKNLLRLVKRSTHNENLLALQDQEF